MSRLGKIAWIVAGIALILLISARYLVGGWIDLLAIPLLLFLISIFAAFMIDMKFYANFLMLKTTKHGMNMGVSLLLAIVLAVVVNYFSVRFNGSIDLTEERLNSLNPQTLKVLSQLDSKLEFFIFYQGAKDKLVRDQVLNTLRTYKEASRQIQIRPVDALVDRVLAQDFLKDIKNPISPLIIAQYKGKRIRVLQPYTEVQYTSALIKATRSESRKIYFLTGHGERAMDNDGATAISELAQSLKDSYYKIVELNLLADGSEVPVDAAVVAIVGPRRSFFPQELKALVNYARQGGKLFVAADPGEGHTVPLLTKVFGIEYQNNYILNDRIKLVGRGAGSSLGYVYSSRSQITEGFRSREEMSLFDLASEVRKAPDAPKNLTYNDLVLTPPSSYAVHDLKLADQPGDRSSLPIGVSVEGALTGELKQVNGKVKYSDSNRGGDKAKGFAAVIFGDSDFLSNNSFFQGVNRDLAMNAFGYLAKEKDLISVRNKSPRGTKLVMTSVDQAATFGVGVGIPVLLLVTSLVMWFRGRGA